MSYDEGPFRNWTAVSFGGVEMTVVLLGTDLIVPNKFLNSQTFADGVPGETNEEKVAPYRKLWTGETSGASFDATAIEYNEVDVPLNGEGYIAVEAVAGGELVRIRISDPVSEFPFINGETVV